MLLLTPSSFVSGGAVLALELLASRIMTPYFGVSLYIWTGILSITLVALALGYWARRPARRRPARRRGNVARLAQLYALMPAVAAFAIVAACLRLSLSVPAARRREPRAGRVRGLPRPAVRAARSRPRR